MFKKLSNNDILKIIKLYSSTDLSVKQISDQFNISSSTVSYIAKKYNIPLRRKINENFIGKTFNRLTVIDSYLSNNRRYCTCKCSCNEILNVAASHLKSGHTKSCGCLITETNSNKSYQLSGAIKKYSPKIASAKRIWQKRYSDGLSFENFLTESQKNCYYCNSEPSNSFNVGLEDKKSSQYKKDNGEFKYNGLDRIDNNKNHSIDNIVPCCKWCNYAKRERSFTDFVKWSEKLYKHLSKNIINKTHID